MTAARTYIDQVKQDFAHAPLDVSFKDFACTLLSNQYDDLIEFRFMEALRNHAPHRSLPAHGYSTADGLHEALSFRCMRYELERAGGFKKRVLNEMPPQVDLRLYSRRYIEAISVVHVELRTHMSHIITASRECIENAIEGYRAKNCGRATGLRVYRVMAGVETGATLMLEWDDVRVHLARKNGNPLRFSERSEISGSRKMVV